MKLIKNFTLNFRHYGEITIPAGEIVTHQTAMGYDEDYCFLNSFGWIKRQYPDIANILKIDLEYHGPNIPHRFIDKYADAPKKEGYLTLRLRRNEVHPYIAQGKYFFSGWEDEVNGDFETPQGIKVRREDCFIIKG